MKQPHHPAIIVGSFNPAKTAEIVELLGELPFAVRSIADFKNILPVPENGTSFAENARIKALGFARQVAAHPILGVVADDSGIEVDAMDGRPGVHSARYAGKTARDPERVNRMLEELRGVPPEKRAARFRCHIAFADEDRVLIETHGKVEGRISLEPAGDFGFGYDPIFIPQGYDRTFAQLGPSVKHSISHRAIALRRFRDALLRMLQARYSSQKD